MSINFWDKTNHVLKILGGIPTVFTRAANGLVPKAPSGSGTTKYLREDGEWIDLKSSLLDLCYPVGSFYISTKNVSPATFLGGTWASRSGYMLRGATSSVTFNSNTKDGGADSVTVTSVASHNHTQDAHKHTQDSHGHGALTGHDHFTNTRGMSGNNPHTHGINQPTQNGDSMGVYGGGGNGGWGLAIAGTNNNWGRLSNQNTDINHTHSIASETTLYVGAAASTEQNKTATNQAKGANYSVSTLPNYKNVYMWERTA